MLIGEIRGVVHRIRAALLWPGHPKGTAFCGIRGVLGTDESTALTCLPCLQIHEMFRGRRPFVHGLRGGRN
jgi:hypothetical protein